MTAPRTNIADELDGRNNEDIARQFGLSPVPPTESTATPAPAPSIRQKLAALLMRVNPSDTTRISRAMDEDAHNAFGYAAANAINTGMAGHPDPSDVDSLNAINSRTAARKDSLAILRQALVAKDRAKASAPAAADATATGINASLPAQPVDTNQVKTRIHNDANQYSQNFDRSVAPQFDLDMGRGLFQLRPDAGDNLEAAKERMAAAEHRLKANRDTLAKTREGKIPTRTRP